jgi:hypothetical protein
MEEGEARDGSSPLVMGMADLIYSSRRPRTRAHRR